MRNAKRRTALLVIVALGASLGMGFIAPTGGTPNDTTKVVELRSGEQAENRSRGTPAGIEDREVGVRRGMDGDGSCLDVLGSVSWASIDNHLDRLLDQARDLASRHHDGSCSH